MQLMKSNDLFRCMKDRWSCRAFRSEPVPTDTIKSILELAQHTASWCNCQPWTVVITSGEGTERLSRTLLEYAEKNAIPSPDYPFPREYKEPYLARRREAGHQLYSSQGISRDDREARRIQELQNFALFDAPHTAIVTTDEGLGVYGAVDCGGYVANFMLAAQAHGVATVAQASLAMYPDLVREVLRLPRERMVVCGISFGYADASHPANSYRTTRADATKETLWISL